MAAAGGGHFHCETYGFSPAILIEQANDPSPEAPPALTPSSSAPNDPAPVEPVAITVEFSVGVKVTIDATRRQLWSRRRFWPCNDPGSDQGQSLDRHRTHRHAPLCGAQVYAETAAAVRTFLQYFQQHEVSNPTRTLRII